MSNKCKIKVLFVGELKALNKEGRCNILNRQQLEQFAVFQEQK